MFEGVLGRELEGVIGKDLVESLKFCPGGKEGGTVGAGCIDGYSHAGCRRDFGFAMCSQKYWVGSSHG